MEENKRKVECQEDLDGLFDAVAATTRSTAIMLTEVSCNGHVRTYEYGKERARPTLASQAGTIDVVSGLIVFRTDTIYSGHGWLAAVDPDEKYCWIIHAVAINWERVRGVCEVGVSPITAALIGIA